MQKEREGEQGRRRTRKKENKEGKVKGRKERKTPIREVREASLGTTLESILEEKSARVSEEGERRGKIPKGIEARPQL